MRNWNYCCWFCNFN